MIFVDSSYFIALSDKRDQWHKKALKIQSKLKESIIVSSLIVSESVSIIGDRKGGKVGMQLYYYFIDNCEIEYVDEMLLRRGMDTFLKYDGTLSISDVISVTILEDRKLKRIISFDSDFDKVKGIKRIH